MNDADAVQDLLRRRLRSARAKVDAAPGSVAAGSSADDLTGRSFLLSAMQERMWLRTRLEPEGTALHLPLRLRLDGPLDVDRLDSALRAIVDHHAVLRVRVTMDGDDTYQTVMPRGAGPLTVRTAADDLETEVANLLRQPFDLPAGPPLRATLFVLGPEEHQLVVVFHHLVCDGWSLNVFVSQLADAYRGEAPQATAQFVEVADAERGPAGAAARTRDAAYWRQVHGTDGPDLAELPFPVPEGPAVADAPVDAALGDLVDRVATDHAVTPAAVWLAALAGWLHSFTTARRVPIGVPSANRHDAGHHATIGPFVSTLPLLFAVSPEDHFDSLVDAAARHLLAGMAHPQVPGEVWRTLGDSRSVLFVHNRSISVPAPRGGLSIRPMPIWPEGAQADLTCVLTVSGIRFIGSSAEQSLLSFLSFTRRLLETPAARLCDQPLTDAVPPIPAVRSGTPLEAFDARVAEAPDHVAVHDRGRAITYGELSDAAHAVADLLRSRGIEPGERVGIALPPGAGYLRSVLGVWRAGAVAVPVDINNPAARTAHLLRLVTARTLISDRHVDGQVDVVRPPEETSGSRAGRMPRPRDPAYVIFTSGSTGEPKPVVSTHGALFNDLAWRRRRIDLGRGDRVLQTIPLSFDPSLWQCIGPLTAGATVVFAEPGVEKDPERLVACCRDLGITVMDVVPTQLAAIPPASLAGLPARVIFCGGEPLTREVVEQTLAHWHGRLFNQYGPTETTIDATSFECRRDDIPARIPIGETIDGVTVRVLDPWQRLVPAGMPGELAIAGAQVSWGYWGGPAATAARFVPDPWASDPGSRMYLTGDRVRRTAKGDIEFLGRRDGQLKIRGHRVEPGEIEQVLLRAAGVVCAAVVPARRSNGEAGHLVGYLTVETGSRLPGIRAYAAAHLPRHMVPAELVVLESLPTTAHGKVDRGALERLAEAHGTTTRRKPQTAWELLVARHFAELLGTTEVGAETNFFHAGGHSLTAATLARRLTRDLGVEVPPRTVFENPTVEGLAAAVPAGPRVVHPPTVEIREDEREWILRLRAALGPEPAIPGTFTLASVDPARLEAAVDHLRWRHSALAGHGLRARPAGDSVTLLLDRERGDGRSIDILRDECLTLLRQQDPELPPAPSYQDWLKARATRAAARRERDLAFWHDRLSGANRDLWRDRRPAGPRSGRARVVTASVPPAVGARLAAMAAERNRGPAAVWIGVLAVLLHRICGQAPVIAIPADRRGTFERLVGRCVTLLPIRCSPAGSFADGLDGITDEVRAAMDHSDASWCELVDLFDPVDLSHRPPLAQAMVNVHRSAPAAPDEDGTVWSEMDLTLHVWNHESGLPASVAFVGGVELFDAAGLAEMLTNLITTAQALGKATA